MEIICCRSTDEIATKAFQLRYQIYGAEIGVNDDAIDHQSKLYIDRFDDASRIYVAIRDGNAIATCRSLYDRDFDFPTNLSQTISSALEIPHFLERYAGSLAISTKFAISPNHRGSLAAHMVTAKMFDDIIEDGIHFVFSWCAPQLYDFYSQLGFHIYSSPFSDDNGLWAPIVLATRDWEHLLNVRSPLYRHLEKRGLCNSRHPSVKWFYDNYGGALQSLLPRLDDGTLERMLSRSDERHPEHSQQAAGLFDSMTTEEIRKITGSGRVLQFAAGDAIINAAQIQDEMFIVLDGDIFEKRLDGELPSSKIIPGQVIGEIAMLTGTIRATDYIAISDTKLVALSRHGLARLMKGNPDIACRLLYNLARLQSFKLLSANRDMIKMYLDINHR
jgi:CRP-like cAMP-binding protein